MPSRIFRFAAWLVVLIGLAAISGTFAPRPLFREQAADEALTRQILVLSNPIHTDIALPIDGEVKARFGFLERYGLPLSMDGARYLAFGWGGRSFYLETPTWSDLKPLPLLKGLTLDASVMHVGLAGEIDLGASHVLAFQVSEAGYQRLLDYIGASFTQSNDAPMNIAGAGYGKFDLFYEANGKFTALRGCNTWTAGGLRAAGLTTGWWNPLPVSLSYSLRLYNSEALNLN